MLSLVFLQSAAIAFFVLFPGALSLLAYRQLPPSLFNEVVEERPEPSGIDRLMSIERRITWKKVQVNSTLACGAPGCEAGTNITVFPGSDASLIHTDCSLDVDVHLTDYDDEFSGERIEWMTVNGVVINVDCFPMMYTPNCSDMSTRPTFPCVARMPLDPYLSSTGTFEVRAKIPQVVDECFYNKSLLSAIATVSCQVGTLPPARKQEALPAAPIKEPEPEPPKLLLPTSLVVEDGLRCFYRGCSASSSIDVQARGRPQWNGSFIGGSELTLLQPGPYNFSRCDLSVRVHQTDYDQDANVEQIEFIRVGGRNLSTNLAPGQNPCRSIRMGKPLTEAERLYSAITGADVLPDMRANSSVGLLALEAKITEYVDECAFEGYLFNAEVVLNCTVNGVLPNVTLNAQAAGSNSTRDANITSTKASASK